LPGVRFHTSRVNNGGRLWKRSGDRVSQPGPGLISVPLTLCNRPSLISVQRHFFSSAIIAFRRVACFLKNITHSVWRDELRIATTSGVYPHDRKGGGLIVIILDLSRETLFACPFQFVFSHSSLMVKPHGCRVRHQNPSHPALSAKYGASLSGVEANFPCPSRNDVSNGCVS